MKKRKALALLMCILLLLLAVACRATPSEVQEDVPATEPGLEEEPKEQGEEAVQEETEKEGTDAEEIPSKEGQEEPRIAMTTTAHPAERNDADGSLLLQERLMEAVISIDGREDVSAAINAVLHSRYTERQQEAESQLEAARQEKESLAALGLSFSGYAVTESIRAERLDAAAISLVATSVDSTGGAHGSTTSKAFNFDSATGEQLSISSLTDDMDALKQAVTQAVIEQIQANPDQYYPNAVDLAGSLLDEGGWYFSSQGLTAFCNPYYMAPFAAGVLEFEIPYTALADVLKPQWLPDPMPAATGEVKAVLATDAGDLELPLQVEVTPEGAQFVLYADGGQLRNVCVQQVSSYDGVNYYAGDVYLAANWLAPGEGIWVQAMLPDVMTNIMISFTRDDGTTVYFGAMESGKDGSILPVELKVVG